jgi:hypothetical protein
MIEYKVRPVTRWVVSRYEEVNRGASCGPVGEFSNRAVADGIAEALASRDGGKFAMEDERDLTDIPLLLRRIASQVEDGEIKASVGVLSLRATGQSRPMVFGFGKRLNGASECGRAAEEILRLRGVPPASKEQVKKALKALADICDEA